MEREEVRERFRKIKERAFRKVDEEWQRALGRVSADPAPAKQPSVRRRWRKKVA